MNAESGVGIFRRLPVNLPVGKYTTLADPLLDFRIEVNPRPLQRPETIFFLNSAGTDKKKLALRQLLANLPVGKNGRRTC